MRKSHSNECLVERNDRNEEFKEEKGDENYQSERKTCGSMAISIDKDSRNKLGKVKLNAILEGNNDFEVNDLPAIAKDEGDEHDLLQMQSAMGKENFVVVVSSGNHGEDLGNQQFCVEVQADYIQMIYEKNLRMLQCFLKG